MVDVSVRNQKAEEIFMEINNSGIVKKTKIKEEITNLELDKRLKKEESLGALSGGEQCFRDDYPWYRLNIGYTNPLNFGEVHAELELIKKHMRQKDNALLQSFKNRHQVFYGIGVGDTEIAFVDWAVKSGQKRVYITGIDVNEEFLKNFIVALRNRTFEPDEPTFYFNPRNSLFEQVSKKELKIQNLDNTHICLGGTIGNFKDQEKLFEMFSNLCLSGDFLILGFQLNNHLKWIFEKYRTNVLFPDFILNYIPKEKRKIIGWKLDKEKGIITAMHDNIEVFRTTKYNSERLKELVTKQGFDFLYGDADEYGNSCIHLYKKK